MFKYYVEGIAFIPSYRDTDFFQTTITADSEEQAVVELKKRYSYIKDYHIEKLDD